MKDSSNHKKSIFQKIFFPIFTVMIVQTSIFIAVAFGGNVIKQLKTNSYDILSEKVVNRRRDLETQFTLNWSNIDSAVNVINALYEEANLNTDVLTTPDAQKKLLADSCSILTQTLRKNNVNGIFLILNDSETYTPLVKDTPQQKYGICIRDLDQSAKYTGTEDLLLDVAPASIVKDIGYSLNSCWSPYYTFNIENDNDYFYKPLLSAFNNPGTNYSSLGFLCTPHKISPNNIEVISYSIPLLSTSGVPYGVLGVELTSDYIAYLMPSEELLSQKSSSYIFGLKSSYGQFTPLITSGVFFDNNFKKSELMTIDNKLSDNCYSFSVSGKNSVCGSISTLDISKSIAPLSGHEFALIGIADHNGLLNFSNNIIFALIISYTLSALIGIVGIVIISHKFAAPITALSNKVLSADPSVPFRLDRLGISEIDRLIDSLETLSTTISKNEAKSEFFSRMNHDMRTPMNAIIGFSEEELVSNSTNEEKTEYLIHINESAKYLLKLINEVLDVSKIENNKVDLLYTPTPITSMWDTIIPIIKVLSDQKNIEFVYDYPSINQNLVALIDIQRIQQIFLNLLSNAVKFTPEGGKIYLNVTIIEQSSKSITQKFIIQDNGIGISNEFKSKIYQKFEQENPGQDGTGLGLTIAQKLINLMGGTISFVSEQGVGTTFTVILKSILSESNEQTLTDNTILTDQLKGKRILLCEDHPLNTQIAKNLIERQGAVCEHAANGKIAEEMYFSSKNYYYDAILMDIRMPIMDGIETTKVIRSLHRDDAKIVPIIAMTANSSDSDITQAISAGMNSYIIKPIDTKIFYSTLIKYLK